MSLGVLNNLTAVYAENNLNNTTNSLQKTLQELSSGSKINSGADDAAGLSLVNGLAANSTALTQSKTNASEGVGLLTVADGALSQVTNLLNRAVTLATEAGNGTLNSSQDAAANQEYQSILSEITNIGGTTTYNQQQVFGSSVSIYTGDSTAPGASINQLNLRSLSSSNIGDSNGAMAYSNGQSNVFIDLSDAGKNAAVTDSLGTINQTTTIAVGYLTQGANGSAVQASANISVGAGTSYANTAQGLISAINNSGLGLTANFGTAKQAGTGATTSALDGSYVNTAALTGGSDTGIIISGQGIGVNTESTTATGVYTNGVGGVGTLTVQQQNDVLGGTLNVTDQNGQTHALTLGTANSTDTLSNLAATLNASGWGVTANVNTTAQTNVSGTHAIGTLMTLTSTSSKAGVTGTSIVDNQETATTITPAHTGVAGAANYTTSLTTAASTDTLNGVVTLASGATTGHTATSTNINVTGMTLTGIYNNLVNNGSATANWSAYLSDSVGNVLTASINTAGTTLTLTENAADAVANPSLAAMAGSSIQDVAATNGTAAVAQTAIVAGNAAAGTAFGTISVTNANDSLGSGTINIRDAAGTADTITLGTVGSTDNLTNLTNYINATMNSGSGTSHVQAVLNSAGTQISLQTSGGGTAIDDPMVYLTNPGIQTSLSLTGTPTTAGTANSTTVGTLSLPVGRTSGDVLTGNLVIGTTTLALGTSTGTNRTDTMANLAQTINRGNFGVTALINSTNTAITFSTANSSIPSITADNVVATGALDQTDGSAALSYNAYNQGVTSSNYYSLGISGTITDASTGGGTAVNGLAFSSNGSGTGVATISYSDAAGVSLNATDLTNSANAEAALTSLNSAIAAVASQDGYIGAQINTLNAVSTVLSTQQENVMAAQNSVQATDYASAASNMSKYEILSQTGISALAQANSMQQEVTKLLQ